MTQTAVSNAPTTSVATPVPGPIRAGDRLLVSVGEALWRTGWDLDRAAFMARVEREHPDALVMTSKGVRVDLLHLLAGSAHTGAAALPHPTVTGHVQFDTLR